MRTYRYVFFSWWACFLLVAQCAAAVTLIPTDPESFFVCPNEPIELAWTTASGDLPDSMDYVDRT
jgi:hypothetical protein